MSVLFEGTTIWSIETQFNAHFQWKAKKYDQKWSKITSYPTPVHTISQCVVFVQDLGNTLRAVRTKAYLWYFYWLQNIALALLAWRFFTILKKETIFVFNILYLVHPYSNRYQHHWTALQQNLHPSASVVCKERVQR